MNANKKHFTLSTIVPIVFFSATVFSTASNAESNPQPFTPINATAAPVAGHPVVIRSKGSGEVRWILPGKRALDPKVFGTPAAPLGFEPDVGVPIAKRLTNADGTAFTTTAMPTAFSNKWAGISGHYHLRAIDATLFDDPDSKDHVKFSATFTSPDGATTYKVRVNKVIPVGPNHPFLGGVGTNFIQHGITGIGTKLMPTSPVFIAFWGKASLEVNGVVVANNRLLHMMATCRMRDADYKLVFDDGVDCSKMHTHVILPPVALTPTGPIASPVPTGFFLPNGMQQPFLHIMFENITMNGVTRYRSDD